MPEGNLTYISVLKFWACWPGIFFPHERNPGCRWGVTHISADSGWDSYLMDWTANLARYLRPVCLPVDDLTKLCWMGSYCEQFVGKVGTSPCAWKWWSLNVVNFRSCPLQEKAVCPLKRILELKLSFCFILYSLRLTVQPALLIAVI